MFSSTLFKSIPCPAGPEKCKLANCLFSHELQVQPSKTIPVASETKTASIGQEHGDLKRRRLSNSTVERIRGDSMEKKTTTKILAPASFSAQKPATTEPKVASSSKVLTSSTRAISPPLLVNDKKASVTKPSSNGAAKPAEQAPEKVERLAPRMVARISTPFVTRTAFLKSLHTELVRLNGLIEKSKDESISSLKLTANQLIRMALDEEEETTKMPAIYPQRMKMRISSYRKMPIEEWTKQRRVAAGLEDATTKDGDAGKGANPDAPFKIETGLSHAEELDMLDRFVLTPQQMSQAGFILTPPTEAQIADAQKTIEASGGYETCDRCGTRFQVLDEPKENGSMTTNGACVHHWGKPIFPKREKTDFITGPKEALYACCNQPKGSPGCSTLDSHVFKISSASPGRLASILQFETTPLNTKAERMAVAFDCEMGYTTAGLEMIRISACKWPSNQALIDVLVKPIGKILDLNTKFSGVTPDQFEDAIDYDASKHNPLPESIKNAEGSQTLQMKIMSSPATTRELLTSYISPATVLIGHAIDNDLNVLRLLHPTIVDTSLLYPHHGGLPYRFPLRKLAKDFLNVEIQTAGAAGHDSMEDSRATGDLVRVKIGREWSKLQKQGWSVKDGVFYATVEGEQKAATLPPYTEGQGYRKKRKASEAPGQVGETVGLKTWLHDKNGSEGLQDAKDPKS